MVSIFSSNSLHESKYVSFLKCTSSSYKLYERYGKISSTSWNIFYLNMPQSLLSSFGRQHHWNIWKNLFILLIIWNTEIIICYHNGSKYLICWFSADRIFLGWNEVSIRPTYTNIKSQSLLHCAMISVREPILCDTPLHADHCLLCKWCMMHSYIIYFIFLVLPGWKFLPWNWMYTRCSSFFVSLAVPWTNTSFCVTIQHGLKYAAPNDK